MDQLADIIAYFEQNPKLAAAIVVGAIGVLFVLFRKPRTVRQANAELKKIRGERAGFYDHLRPPN